MPDPIDDTHAGLTGWANPIVRLRQAIEKDHFVLYAQAVLALKPGAERYPMAEVLVRMREEESALLPPGEFFPVFEHYRMMPQLDRWVVQAALKQLAAGAAVKRLTINLSAQTLDDAEFPRFVADRLSASGVSAAALLFEIDESDTLARLDAATKFAQAYRALGGAVLVDGFGYRSVSFAAINALRPALVKVDGSITRKLGITDIADGKLAAIVRVGKIVGYGVTAEFVEDQNILARLKGLGVDYAQGFGIHQPQPLGSLGLHG